MRWNQDQGSGVVQAVQEGQAASCCQQAWAQGMGCLALRPHWVPWEEGEGTPPHQQREAWAVQQGQQQRARALHCQWEASTGQRSQKMPLSLRRWQEPGCPAPHPHWVPWEEGEETLDRQQQGAWVEQQGQQQRAKALGCPRQASGCQAPRPHWVP